MENLPLPKTPSDFWISIFITMCAVMFLGCLFHAIKMGIWEYHNADPRDGRFSKILTSLTQVLSLLMFVVLYWVLESTATYYSPYYLYSIFPGSIPQLFYLLGSAPPATTGLPCPTLVNEIKAANAAFNYIPSSVLLMEAAITYASMWTALILRARYYLVPVLTGLVSWNVDVIMDPVVAVVYDCHGNILRGGDGLAFWHWYSVDLESNYMPTWFGVPLFNFAAWWAAPFLFVCIVMLAQYLRNRLWRVRRGREPIVTAPSGRHAAIFALVILAVGVYYLLNMFQPGAPEHHTATLLQWSIMAGVMAASVLWIALERRNFDSVGRSDPFLTHPLISFIALALVGLLFNGIFQDMPALLPVALAAVVVGLILVFWPYGDTICSTARAVIDLDRFVRLHYFGYTSMLVLLGGFAAVLSPATDATGLSGWTIGALLLIAVAFHVYAYVLNDVIDLEVDRHQRKRQLDPLVRGAVSRFSALALALVQIPAASLVLFTLDAPLPAYAALWTAFGLMTVYDVWGKVSRFPPLTDLVQALAWGSLVWVGAYVGAPSGINDWLLVWAIFLFGAGFILLINGVHGGLRDLRNDADKGCRTTAIVLGSYWDPEAQHVVSSARLATFAFAVHTLMFALPLLIALQFPFDLDALAQPWSGEFGVDLAIAAVAVTFALSNYYLWNVVKPRVSDAERDRRLERQIFIVLLPPILFFLPLVNMEAGMVLWVTFFGPLLAQSNVIEAIVQFLHPGHRDDLLRPPGLLNAAGGTGEAL